MQNGALMTILASRTCRTVAQVTGTAKMGASVRTPCVTAPLRAARRSNANMLVAAYVARENGEMVYQRTDAHNNRPPQVTLSPRFGSLCR